MPSRHRALRLLTSAQPNLTRGHGVVTGPAHLRTRQPSRAPSRLRPMGTFDGAAPMVGQAKDCVGQAWNF